MFHSKFVRLETRRAYISLHVQARSKVSANYYFGFWLLNLLCILTLNSLLNGTVAPKIFIVFFFQYDLIMVVLNFV